MSDKKSNMGAYKDSRRRTYASVLYPESAPEDWQTILQEQFIPAFISPLHDKDINPTGEPKKAHYHIMLMYDAPKTTEQAREVFAKVGAVGCEVVQSTRGYARYLCHLDNPDKVQYSVDDVKAFCGADYVGTIGLAIDKYKAVREMIAFCKEYNVDAYCDLLIYASEQRSDWFRVLCDNGTVVMKEFLKSKSWKDSKAPLPPC